MGKRVVLDYNPGWQPVGFSANKFTRQIGKLIRSGNYVHLRDDWAHVPARTKEDIWEVLMVSGLLHTSSSFFFNCFYFYLSTSNLCRWTFTSRQVMIYKK
jgi:hypothetical protein